MVKSAPPISSMSPLAPVSELIWTLAKLGTAGKPRIFAVPCASKSSPVYMRSTLNARGAHTVSVSCMMFPPEVFDEPVSCRGCEDHLEKLDETVGQGPFTSELLLVGPTAELITGNSDGARLPALRIRFTRWPVVAGSRAKTHRRRSLSHGAGHPDERSAPAAHSRRRPFPESGMTFAAALSYARAAFSRSLARPEI